MFETFFLTFLWSFCKNLYLGSFYFYTTFNFFPFYGKHFKEFRLLKEKQKLAKFKVQCLLLKNTDDCRCKILKFVKGNYKPTIYNYQTIKKC